MAANRKRNTYSDIIEQNYFVVQFVFETFGPWCEEAVDIMNSFGARIAKCTGGPNRKIFSSTLPSSDKLNEVYSPL